MINNKQSNNTPARSLLCFSLLLSLTYSLISCNKEPRYETMYLDAGLKAAFNNKPGSYWIYRDSVSGETDSLYLVSNKLKIDEGYTNSHGKKYEEMRLEYASKHFGLDTSYELSLGFNFSTRQGNMLGSALNGISIQPLNFWFNYPFNYPGAINKDDTVVYSVMSEPFVLGAVQFDRVTVFSQYPKADVTKKSTGFWSDKTGLIKMRFLYKSSSGPAVKVLELQRWKLIQ